MCILNLRFSHLHSNKWLGRRWGGEKKGKACSSVTSKTLSLDMVLPLYFVSSYFSRSLGVFCKTKPSKSPSTRAQMSSLMCFIHSYINGDFFFSKNSSHENSWCYKIYRSSYLRLLYLCIHKHKIFCRFRRSRPLPP